MKIKTILACTVAVIALPGIAEAAEDHSVSIPAEEAAKSIPELARQEIIKIVVSADQLQGIRTAAVNGTMNANQALGDLLVGTGLEVAQNDGNTVVLRRASTAVDVPQALAGQAGAATAAGSQLPTETVTVTGSRVISDIQASPTPVTIVTTEQLQATTPSDLPDGLNKLPVFQGSNVPRLAGNGGGGNSSSGGVPQNVLNLRNFGVQRTLVLIDGHRATPTNADGTVDVDTLPQMLVSRVDVVTGGASAVYGSDAVTGVVNFILDKKFEGLKFDANAGISTYGDGASYKVGAAFGTDLFGGRVHFEGALRHFQQDTIPAFARPLGALVVTQGGSVPGGGTAGTATNPFTNVLNTRKPDSPLGGLIQGCLPACPLADNQQFVSTGTLGPFFPGQLTGTSNQNSGGDGGFNKFGTAQAGIRQNELFSRVSYDVDPETVFYVQGTASESFANGWWFPTKETPTNSSGGVAKGAVSASGTSNLQASTFYKNNAFLPAAVQTALGNNGTNPLEVQLSPTASPNSIQPSNTFQLGEYIQGTGPTGLTGTRNVDRNLNITTGLDGMVFGRYSWDLFYTHGENRQAVDNLNNSNYQRQFAASDAVLNASGQVVCYATTPAAGAAANAAYASCVPIDPFGPTAISQSAYKYITGTTFYHMTNTLDDLGGSISGTVFDGWAGPINAALSAEMRWNGYAVVSNASSNATVDCTGLRICNQNLPLWAQNIVNNVNASNNVWEFAGEVDAPLVKDVPMIQSLSLNLAGRYTDYSTSGAVQTWKIGLNWQVDNSVRFRGTTSIDIRAPTLNDLFQPSSQSVTGYTDFVVQPNATRTLFLSNQGNPNLVPEVARTYTAGIVVTPDFIPGLTTSFDYYLIKLNNAISNLSATSQTLQLACAASGGTLPLCSLWQRPFPYSNTTQANFPTAILSENVNASFNEIEGWDYEADYGWEMADIIDGWRGSWTTRLLANYQPVNENIQLPGQTPLQWTAAPKGHVTGFLRYELDNWAIGLEDRWIGGFSKKTTALNQNYVNPHVHSVNYLDLNLERSFGIDGASYTGYFTVQNLTNAQSDIYTTSGSVGLAYPIPFGQDLMGRYFTVGIRASL
jgi:iron complex outermembrane recepter protein